MQFISLLFIATIWCSVAQATPPVIRAAQTGNMSLFVQLINGGTDINAVNAIRRTALHYMVEQNNMQGVQMLLDKGAEVNLVDNAGNTPLDLWHKHENDKMLALLQAAGAQPLDLWHAAAANSRTGVVRLLAAGADAKITDAAGKAPFHIAVEAGHDALAAILLHAAHGIDGKDEKSWRPLHWAIVADDWDLVRKFIREGADVGAGRRQTAVDIATMMESEIALLEVLIDEKGVDAVVYAAFTLLSWAAREGRMDMVKFLIARGADPNAKDRWGRHAITWAARERHTDIVKFLVNRGADVNMQSNTGGTALAYAVLGGDLELVEFLVEQGADVNTADRYLATSLMWAASKGFREIVEFLLARGADPLLKDNQGEDSTRYGGGKRTPRHRRHPCMLPTRE